MPLLVVVDPQGDLADAMTGQVPEPLRQHLHYLDVGVPGSFAINLLAASTSRDGDRHVEQIVQVLRQQWADSWGPRMDTALRIALHALYAANLGRGEDEQYTILHVTDFLTDPRFRGDVLRAAGDDIGGSWERFLEGTRASFQAEVMVPATGKILQFQLNSRAREIFGGARTTLSLRRAIADGGILIAKIPAGKLGENATELIGAGVLNLLTQMIDEQSALPPPDRRPVICIVDEATLLATVNYRRMFAGLRASGGAFVIATQALAQLDAVDPALTETILGNIDALTVFNVGPEDALRLQQELGEPLIVADITDLDRYNAYARWWDGVGRGPVFSFRILPPVGEHAVSETRPWRTQADWPQPLERQNWLEMQFARVRALLGL